MYCELKNREVELLSNTKNEDTKVSTTKNCSENSKKIAGITFHDLCELRINERCLQSKNRFR